MIDALDIPAQRILFVDDNLLNVEAAASLGIIARRVAGVDGVRDILREIEATR